MSKNRVDYDNYKNRLSFVKKEKKERPIINYHYYLFTLLIKIHFAYM